MVEGLLDHVRPALTATGDLDAVERRLETVVTSGTGADHQRAVHRRTGRLVDVVADAADRTLG